MEQPERGNALKPIEPYGVLRHDVAFRNNFSQAVIRSDSRLIFIYDVPTCLAHMSMQTDCKKKKNSIFGEFFPGGGRRVFYARLP